MNQSSEPGIFPCVAPEVTGYSPRDVDRYFAGEGPADFLAVKGGYDPAAVDAAVDAREDDDAVAAADARREEIGDAAFAEELAALRRDLMARALREPGTKFRKPPVGIRIPGFSRRHAYSAPDVDGLCQLLAEALENPAGGVLAPAEIRAARFSQARASGYEESQVDAFLEDAARFLAVARAQPEEPASAPVREVSGLAAGRRARRAAE